ncbi:SprT family zinc-dependent metalloprotease [Conexibacter sp. JD483]|uniref:M48 family metallopeptidase n=1 Tax=unclassified Conexibacter TaxID=2627773 RepID=UPI00271A8CD7|nr:MULTISPECIES: SprT family zinc-dependent metalloprotease [unclassified Conexibacter]MDO8188378.1 SprT family zinc-dependent metalloprotease [Conexibacter sp. CPCC 205706]MDO8201124.1 SprT family zinc-dependent metalloprotease [Conexibacter sp. CPCC 205762]MDR9371576.1 SprT family zinc-dependent metalloprotease [Conexibacter sp. JD483]
MTRVEGDISYRVRRSDRARRVRVRVDEQSGVEVVLPRRTAEREAAAAIRQLRPWIERRIAELERHRAAIAARGATVPYLGQTLALVAEPGRTRVHRSGERLLVPGAPADGEASRAALERWYRRRAAEEIAPRLDAATARAGTRYTKLTIRGQRTRWASCSTNGGMSFNWRLLLAPAPVLDYVVWHEVCHLEVMDHSPRFWNLLASRWPDYEAHQAWLRRHGATLVL